MQTHSETKGLLRRAVNFLKRKKPRQALKVLLKAKAKDRNNALVYYNLGLAYKALKEYRRAMDCYQSALSRDPKLTDAVVCQAYIFGFKGNYHRELASYDEVLRRDPKHAIALYNKAVVLDDEFKKPRLAIPLYCRTLKLPLTRQQKRGVHLRLVYGYLDIRQYKKAAESLKKLL